MFDICLYLEKIIFKELKDLFLFKFERVSFDTVECEYEADIDPKTLYEDSVPL